MKDLEIRHQLIKMLNWEDAHSSINQAINNIQEDALVKKVPKIDYNIWQLSSHIQFAMHDIFEFCTNSHYQEPKWPDDYWPQNSQPENKEEWENLCKKIQQDQQGITQLINNPQIDLFEPLNHSQGQNIFREIMLIIDHSSYHIGQIVLIRKILGVWKS